MVNSQINKEIEKARMAYGYSLIEESYQDFKNWTSRRNNEWNLERGKGFSRESKTFECEFCGKVYVELDSLRTPAYIRYRTHRWRCERKQWEEELKNFHDYKDSAERLCCNIPRPIWDSMTLEECAAFCDDCKTSCLWEYHNL